MARRTKDNESPADDQAKAMMSKTGLMIAASFHEDASLAPVGHYTIPKMIS